MDRLVTKGFPDGSTTEYTYTPTGQRASVIDDCGITTYTYDGRDRVLSRTNPDGETIEYAYDLAGNRTGITTASGTTRYSYDQRDRLISLSHPAIGTTRYTYDQADNVIETQFPNGTLETRNYDSRHRLVSLETALVDEQGQPLEIISSYDYTLNSIGNRISVLEANGRQVDYQYDSLERVTQEKIIEGGETRTIDYSYDPVGNRLGQEDSVKGRTTYTYNEND